MMKKMLWLLFLLLPVLAFAEEACPLCGGTSELCLTDEVGAVYCSGTLVSCPEDAATAAYAVREGTQYIGEWAFAGNEALTAVALPAGVVVIDAGAFEGCTSLQTVTLPETLLIIGNSAFYNCPALTDITLPKRLYAIGAAAFVDCTSLTSLCIPETVRYIGSEAFCNTGLSEVWWQPVFFETGFCVFLPNEQFGKAQPLTVHVSEALSEEIGDISNFCCDYEEGYNITFVMDIPYDWD